jgi:hypothetical protein
MSLDPVMPTQVGMTEKSSLPVTNDLIISQWA